MNIQVPGGVEINPYPKETYEQPFECFTLNCGYVLTFAIPLVVPPNALILYDKSDWIWRCPKCGVLQTTEQDLPRSKPLGNMQLKPQGGDNGSGKRKRKRKGKDKSDE